MIVPAELHTLAEVGLAALVLSQHDVGAALLQIGDLEKRAKMAVAEHHVARLNVAMQAAEQGQLARFFALVWTESGIEDRADGQRKDHQEAQDREADARLLTGHL